MPHGIIRVIEKNDGPDMTRYRAYQDAFQARKNMQLLPVPQELEKVIL